MTAREALLALASFFVPGLGQLLQRRLRAAATSLVNGMLLVYAVVQASSPSESGEINSVLFHSVFFVVCAVVHVFQALEAAEHDRRSRKGSERHQAPIS